MQLRMFRWEASSRASTMGGWAIGEKPEALVAAARRGHKGGHEGMQAIYLAGPSRARSCRGLRMGTCWRQGRLHFAHRFFTSCTTTLEISHYCHVSGAWYTLVPSLCHISQFTGLTLCSL